MAVNWQIRMHILFIAINILTITSIYTVNAFVHRYAVDKPDEPLVKEQHSINSDGINESVVSREVINHVRHQHQQTIGNIHILTNIDIANLITILNGSAVTSGQSTGSPTTSESPKNNKPHTIHEIPLDNKYEPFERTERTHGIGQPPLIFPKSENSRRVRWPTEKHSVHAIDVKTVISPSAIIAFPRSDSESDNKLPSKQSAEIPSIPSSIAFQYTKMNEQSVTPIIPSSVNISTYIVNQTAIENGMMPMIYIDDDGIFQVKYVPKGEYVTLSNADQQQSFTSINKTEEVAIIANDNRQFLLNQHFHNETNTLNTPSSSSLPSTPPRASPIDIIRNQAINNTEAMHTSHHTHTRGISSEPDQQQQQQQHEELSENEQPRLFNELPIFT